MAKFIPDKFQVKVYDFMETGTGNAVIDAVAGSGKTTTIVNALRLIPEDQSVLFLAFNKSIVNELTERVGALPNVTVKTLHSLGTSCIRPVFRSKVNPDKYRSFLSEGFKTDYLAPTKDLNSEELAEYRTNIKKLVNLIRVNLCRSYDQAKQIAWKHGIFLQDNELEVVNKAIKYGRKNTREIDFTDMIYYPNAFDIRVPKYDWVLIDECQDLNAAQRGLFLKCVKPETGRFIAVGDPRQAIYGFAGADANSFKELQKLPNTVTLPLSRCYRCGSDIIELAKEIVPQIEARENAHTGEICNDSHIEDVQDGDMVLCRLTAPLVSLCVQYISENVKAFIKGKDIGENLINLVKRTQKTNIDKMFRVLEKEEQKLLEVICKQKKLTVEDAQENSYYQNYVDKVAALRILAEGQSQTRQLISRIEQIFKNNEKQGICLSTIHKSKGLEADRVFILSPEKMLLKHAMKIEWMAEQEFNLVYVAYTRAKHYLGFINEFRA